MAKPVLPVDFQDDIMNADMGGKRRYRLINNTDGTVSFEDVTTYDQVGSNFGAGQINQTNAAVNESLDSSKVIDDMDDIVANTKPGMPAGALAVTQLTDGGTMTEVKFVDSLPSDAASHPTTFYWVKG